MSEVPHPRRTTRLPALLDVRPRLRPLFDPGFRPIILAFRNYQDSLKRHGRSVKIKIGVERERGLVSTFTLSVLPGGLEQEATRILVERTVKFLLWSRGGWRILFAGPSPLFEYLRAQYAEAGPRAFDVRLMSGVYEREFEVVRTAAADFPQSRESRSSLGGHWDGCRVGFDLGASDIKIAAVQDGRHVFSEEIPWNPGEQVDPKYHAATIRAGIKKAAARLPRLDAIGGSAAGIYIGNQVRIASLFRSVPPAIFEREVKGMFLRMREEWKVPLEVVNDGEVAALAGKLTYGENAVLGVAMGSSQAAGFLDAEGRLPGWLDELAFAPVDLNPEASADEWSADRGLGVTAFSQQAVNKLALAAGFPFPESARLPERLKRLQELVEQGDRKSLRVFKAIGIYLGYTIPFYRMFYDFRNLIILGRVMSGTGGQVIIDEARKVLKSEFPGQEERIRMILADETSRRLGQAVAAASLPELKGTGGNRDRGERT